MYMSSFSLSLLLSWSWDPCHPLSDPPMAEPPRANPACLTLSLKLSMTKWHSLMESHLCHHCCGWPPPPLGGWPPTHKMRINLWMGPDYGPGIRHLRNLQGGGRFCCICLRNVPLKYIANHLFKTEQTYCRRIIESFDIEPNVAVYEFTSEMSTHPFCSLFCCFYFFLKQYTKILLKDEKRTLWKFLTWICIVGVS